MQPPERGCVWSMPVRIEQARIRWQRRCGCVPGPHSTTSGKRSVSGGLLSAAFPTTLATAGQLQLAGGVSSMGKAGTLMINYEGRGHA